MYTLRGHSTEPQPPDQLIRERLQFGLIFVLPSQPSILFTAVIASVAAFARQETASILLMSLVEYREMSSTTAAVLFTSYLVVQVVVKPGVDRLSDIYGQDLVVEVSIATR